MSLSAEDSYVPVMGDKPRVPGLSGPVSVPDVWPLRRPPSLDPSALNGALIF